MLSIQLPHIAVQKVSNGWVVQWQTPAGGKNGGKNLVSRVCLDTPSLVEVIEHAAAEVGGDCG